MKKILCIYYSRTGNTRRIMEEIASLLGAELVEMTDGVKREGLLGFVRSGFDAVQESTWTLEPYKTELPLHEYDLVIVGTPVWAGRCSSIAREFLKKQGRRLKNVAYVVTRSSPKEKYESVFKQMDLYTDKPHVCAVSLHSGDVGESFWRDEFIRDVKNVLGEE